MPTSASPNQNSVQPPLDPSAAAVMVSQQLTPTPAPEAPPAGAVDEGIDLVDALSADVNTPSPSGGESPGVTQPVTGPLTATQQSGGPTVNWESDENPYKQRYADSTRQFQRTQEEMATFNPIIDAAKKDPNFVQHIRSYLQNPQEVSPHKQLGLSDDFSFNPSDLAKQGSDSAKFFNHMVAQAVNAAADQREQLQADHQRQTNLQAEAAGLRDKFNLSDQQYQEFMDWTKGRKMSIEDAYKLMVYDRTMDQANQHVRQDMLNQVAVAQQMPSGAGNMMGQGNNLQTEEQIFGDFFGSNLVKQGMTTFTE